MHSSNTDSWLGKSIQVNVKKIKMTMNVIYPCGCFMGWKWAQTNQNWCQDVNFSTILTTFVYVVPL